MRVLLVDMPPMLRDLVRSVLADAPAVAVVGELDTSADVAETARRLRAEVVICGVREHEPVVDVTLLLSCSVSRILAIGSGGTGDLYEMELLRRDLGALSPKALVSAVSERVRAPPAATEIHRPVSHTNERERGSTNGD
jgi:DNA-binding NarL/FixJ family response regulator